MIQQAHIKTYDVLIGIIPLFKHVKQALVDNLCGRKRFLQQRYGMHA